MIINNDARTASSNGANRDKFSEQHQYQSIKKRTIHNAKLGLFWCRFNANFSWVNNYFITENHNENQCLDS